MNFLSTEKEGEKKEKKGRLKGFCNNLNPFLLSKSSIIKQQKYKRFKRKGFLCNLQVRNFGNTMNIMA